MNRSLTTQTAESEAGNLMHFVNYSVSTRSVLFQKKMNTVINKPDKL
jgi:hypothetical protein